jgi:NADPH-ferrihemoprotein reductase
LEKAKLHQWTHEGKDEFHKDEKSILEVLEELPNADVPFLDFLEFCPKLQPRFYTISSSSLVQPKQVSITVALSTHMKPRGRVYNGIATTYLCNLKPGKEQVCVFLRPSTFRLPKPKRTFINGSPTPLDGSAASTPQSTSVLPPIIMVGPGTGVAPFRAFVQEFHYLRAKNLPAFPSTHLFFGCRNREHDYIYKDEMTSAVGNESLTCLHTAFSRETSQKVYVQSDLKAHAEQVWQLISTQRAYFYVCGGTIMGRQVKEVMQHIVEQHGSLTPQAATEYVKKMQTDGRYVQVSDDDDPPHAPDARVQMHQQLICICSQSYVTPLTVFPLYFVCI